MRVLVTGATGYLGQDVCRVLLESGLDIIGNDQNHHSTVPMPMRIVDLRDRYACYKLLEEIDVIVHLAAHPHDNPSSHQMVLNENVAMTMNLLEAALELGIKKFIFASSVQAMAARRHKRENGVLPPSRLDYLPADGEMPAHPSTPYALSKHFGEELCKMYAREYGMTCIAIRFPWLIRKDDSRLLRWIARHYSSYIEESGLDECFACLTSLDAGHLIRAILQSNLTGYRCYFPSMSKPITNRPIPELIQTYYQGVPLRQKPEEMNHLVDISKITQETGWFPQYDLSNLILEYKSMTT